MTRITLSRSRIQELMKMAKSHLEQNSITVEVDRIGSQNGQELFGIVFRSGFEEQWFNDGLPDSDEVLAWSSIPEATKDLNEYVLPNLAILIEKQKIKQFQMNL